MPKHNICFFNTSKTWGGGEKWHYDMAFGIDSSKFNRFVVSGKQSELADRLQKIKMPHIDIGISNLSFLNPFKIRKIFNFLKSRHIDTIIINLSEDLKIAGPAAKLAGVKNIIYRRGSAIPITNSVFNRFLFRYILTGIIANSQQTKNTILQNNYALFPEDKITVIYNGISLDPVDDTAFKPLYQRQTGETVLGNAGRLVEQKGQKYLIDIATKLKAQNINFKLLIAGEGKLLDDLQQRSIDAGVAEELLFLGFVDDMQGFMKTIDIFLLPSLWEGFGYVIVEAMAAGKPVIAYNVSSNPEIIKNNQTGYLVEDIHGFVESIRSLVQNVSKREEMGKAARQRVKSIFDIEITTKKLMDFINALE